MIHWKELFENSQGQMVYKKVDEDGLVRITAVPGYQELDEYLASIEATEPEEE